MASVFTPRHPKQTPDELERGKVHLDVGRDGPPRARALAEDDEPSHID